MSVATGDRSAKKADFSHASARYETSSIFRTISMTGPENSWSGSARGSAYWKWGVRQYTFRGCSWSVNVMLPELRLIPQPLRRRAITAEKSWFWT